MGGTQALVVMGGGVQPAFALAVLRAGVVRRRIRPPALDGVRHVADSSVGVHLSVGQVTFSMSGFVLLYSALLIVELFLMIKYARLGPSSLGTGRYHFENGSSPAPAAPHTAATLP